MHPFDRLVPVTNVPRCDLQSQKAVTAKLKSKQLPSFVFAFEFASNMFVTAQRPENYCQLEPDDCLLA